MSALVSIIIPVYNKEKYIENSLMSVLEQTYSELEIICVDDCSTDGSIAIAEKLKQQYGKIVILRNSENRGPGYARNQGLDFSHGEYVYFLDADDRLQDNAIERLVGCIEKTEVECVFFDTTMEDDTAIGMLPIQDFSIKPYEVFSGQELFVQLYSAQTLAFAPWRQFWRKDALEKYDLKFPEYMLAEDGLFSIHAYMKMKKATYLPEALHICVRNEGSLSNTYSETRVITTYKIYCEYLSILQEWTIEQETKIAFTKYIQRYLDKLRRLYSNNTQFEYEMIRDKKERERFLELMKEKPKRRFYDFDKEKLDTFKRKGVYIYGAGDFANEVYSYLKQEEITIHGLIVTKKNGKRSIEAQIQIYELQEIENKEIEIIIGTNKQNCEVIFNNLTVEGYQKIYCLNYTE